MKMLDAQIRMKCDENEESTKEIRGWGGTVEKERERQNEWARKIWAHARGI